MRDYVAVPYEYIDELDELDDEEFGRLMRGLLLYSRDGVPIQATGNERFYVKRVMNREDRYRSNFDKTAERKVAAGRRGASARWHGACDAPATPATEDATACDGIAEDSRTCEEIAEDATACDGMTADSENGNTDTDTEADAKANAKANTEAEYKDQEKKKTAAYAASGKNAPARREESQEEMYERLSAVFEPGSITDGLDCEIRRWIRYKTERKQTYKESGMAALLRKIVLDETARHGEQKVCSLIEDCMASNYSGIVWDILDKPKGGYSAARSRDRPKDIVEQMRDW